jgi:hypothetical protein
MMFRGAGYIVANRPVGPSNAGGWSGFIIYPSRCLAYSKKIWSVPLVLPYMWVAQWQIGFTNNLQSSPDLAREREPEMGIYYCQPFPPM